LIEINAGSPAICDSFRNWEVIMAVQDIVFLVFVVSAFSLFGGVLGFASWSESRRTRK
jgi:hypothetical protein